MYPYLIIYSKYFQYNKKLSMNGWKCTNLKDSVCILTHTYTQTQWFIMSWSHESHIKKDFLNRIQERKTQSNS